MSIRHSPKKEKMAKFFRSVGAFFKQNYKPLIALVCVAVICGGVLALGSDLFKVDETERTARDLRKIYPDAKRFEKRDVINELETNSELFGKTMKIIYAYKVYGNETDETPSAVIVKARSGVSGFKGYSEVVIAVGMEGKIVNVIVSSFGGDDRTANVNAKYFENNYIGRNIFEVEHFDVYAPSDAENSVDIVSGATFSVKSIAGAVNAAIWYIREAELI